MSKNMIKTHTAQSLAKYLGKKVLFEGQAYFLEGIHIWTNHGRAYIFKEHQEQIFLAPIKDIYPILKDYTKLLEPMEYEGEKIIPIGYIYNAYMPCRVMHNTIIDRYNTYACNIDFSCPTLEPEPDLGGYTPDIIEKLINLGFGAIKDEESPTGYVDLFGYVCEVER